MLTKAEMNLYRRHIDDGMDFKDLATEFRTTAQELRQKFIRIERKLVRKFNGL
jgi:hypothetical protein